jgi:hypothetical protein
VAVRRALHDTVALLLVRLHHHAAERESSALET